MGRAAAFSFSAKMEARSGVWLLLLLSIGVFVQAAPSGDLLERLDNHDLDALVEIDEEQPEKADAAQERKAPIDDLAKQAKQANEEERDRKDSKDPYKQRKTYTKAMKKYEKRTKWEKEHPVVRNGKKRKFDPLNDFKNPSNERKRAAKIAKDIYRIIKKPVAKKATLSAVDRSVLRIKERGRKDAAKLKRIRKAIIRRDKREKKRQRKDDSRLTKEKRKPKLAIKHRIEKVMSDEDKKLEKDPRKASPEAIAAVERSAQPVRKKAYGASYRSAPPQLD